MLTFNYNRINYPSVELQAHKTDEVLENLNKARSNFLSEGALLIRKSYENAPSAESVGFLDEVGAEFGSTRVRDAYRRVGTTGSGAVRVDPDEVHRPHAEASFSPGRPSVLVFGCMSQSDELDSGGLTTLIDGVELWNRLDIKSKEILLNTSIEYKLCIRLKPRPSSSGEVRPWFLPEIGVRDTRLDTKRGHLLFTYKVPFLLDHPITRSIALSNHAFIDPATEEQIASRKVLFPSFLPEKMIDDLKEDIHESLDLSIKTLAWKQGDILVLDNMRFMHGRLPIVKSLKRKLNILQFKLFVL